MDFWVYTGMYSVLRFTWTFMNPYIYVWAAMMVNPTLWYSYKTSLTRKARENEQTKRYAKNEKA